MSLHVFIAPGRDVVGEEVSREALFAYLDRPRRDLPAVDEAVARRITAGQAPRVKVVDVLSRNEAFRIARERRERLWKVGRM